MRSGKFLLHVLAGLALLVAAPAWAECDCTQYPFVPDPPCFNKCAGRLISRASPDSLESVLGLSPATAKRIASPRFAGTPSLHDYRLYMSPAEFTALEARMRELTRQEFDRLGR